MTLAPKHQLIFTVSVNLSDISYSLNLNRFKRNRIGDVPLIFMSLTCLLLVEQNPRICEVKFIPNKNSTNKISLKKTNPYIALQIFYYDSWCKHF